MKVEKVYYMLMAEDMDRAVGFYRDVVGLEVKSTSRGWSELTYGDATVALHGGGTGEQSSDGNNGNDNDNNSHGETPWGVEVHCEGRDR